MNALSMRRMRYTGELTRKLTAKPAAQPAQLRDNALAQIHIAKKQLGLDDGTYRDMLWGLARVRSAKDLDHAGRQKVLAHLKASGFKSSPPKTPTPGRPSNMQTADRGPMLRKVEALLLSAGREWEYAHSMCRHMFHKERLEFINEAELHKLVAALEVDKKRRAERALQAQQDGTA